MFVKQLSVFLENNKGTLNRMTRLLGDAGLDLIAMSIADTENYGILRLIVNDTDKGVQVLKDAGYAVRITEVLAVCVSDRPGGLADVLEYLSEADISVEYLYSFVRAQNGCALIIFHLSDLERGGQILEKHHIKMLQQEEIRSL